MKILFAVSDDNISTAIVQRYRKQYKEIILYKNVYYFNAILTELHKNKTYDRIVISEDLDKFADSSLTQQDKFIFDKLDSISDEAVSEEGKDIPIILICTERRTKSEDILVKLFGISIYNAIIGQDRTIEEVCKLINKPRSKKEAKLYYKIDTEKVNYEKENESDVSESEIQSILRHFKRLGKNEEKYVDSFNKIISQYNDSQLKLIAAILPEDVKSVLEEKSPEYRSIVGNKNNELANTSKKGKKTSGKNKSPKGTSETLLDENNNKLGIMKPIVVPTTMEKSMYKKVNAKKKIDIDLEELEDEDIKSSAIISEEKPKKRGRPRKKSEIDEENDIQIDQIEEKTLEKKPKRRGRPKKEVIDNDINEKNNTTLPGFEDEDDDEDDDLITIDSLLNEDNEKDSNTVLPGFNEDDDEIDEYDDEYDDESDDEIDENYDDEYDDSEEYDDEYDDDEYEENETYEDDINSASKVVKSSDEEDEDIVLNNKFLKHYDNSFSDGQFEALLTGDKKVVAFVGTSKNGTSFVVNNIAQILSEMGINTAILDATKNKNAFYIYTKNDEDLRKTAISSIYGLKNGTAQGVKVNNYLTVYTTIPSQGEDICNSRPIMETLVKNHTLVLIDCDFNTPIEYFDNSQELYLIQSMDVLTIQPLTEFLRELKIKNVLSESKIRIVLNKLLRIKGVTGKSIVGGMANYNDPEMSFMTELFDKNLVRTVQQIPFDEDVYAKYLEGLIECDIKVSGYPKEFKQKLTDLANIIYPTLPGKNNDKKNKKNKKNKNINNNEFSGTFSSGMNDTLNNMRKKY